MIFTVTGAQTNNRVFIIIMARTLLHIKKLLYTNTTDCVSSRLTHTLLTPPRFATFHILRED